MGTYQRNQFVLAASFACMASLSAETTAAQSAPLSPLPPPPEGCRIWEAHISYVIEQHKRAGTSESALGEALDLAYATYGKCVMYATDDDMNQNAISALDRIKLVLSRGSTFATANSSPKSAGTDR